MKLWDKIKERRITQILITYVAGGWIAITVVDTLVDRQTLPELVFRLALVAFVGGFFVALILGWYHGEVGRQKVAASEFGMLTLVGALTVLSGIVVLQRHGADDPLDRADLNARRVAVLYFHAAEGPDDLGYLADGLTESLISELSRIPELDVISRNGVAPFRGRSNPPEEIGRALNAGSLIDGSVERASGGIRVNIQLLDGPSGAAIDRTAFTLQEDQFLAARDSVVAMAGDFLRNRLGEELRLRDLRAEAQTVEGWTLFQRAERLRKEALEAVQHDRDEALALLARADSLLDQARALEPEWADPPALQADLALRRGSWARSLPRALESHSQGIEHANRALEIQPRHARALETRGNLHRFHWFLNVSSSPIEREELLDRAERDLRAAVESDPTLASAHALLSRLYYDRRDRLSAAMAAMDALRADYYLADADEVLQRAFASHYDLAQFTQARDRCEEGARRFPDNFNFLDCRIWLMSSPVGDPNPDSAWAFRARADSLTPPATRAIRSHIRMMAVGGVLARAGMADSARAVVEAARGGPEVDPDQTLLGYEAVIRTILGDHDEAVQLLRRYVVGNPDHIEGLLRVEGDLHWWWRPLRDHPAFRALVGADT